MMELTTKEISTINRMLGNIEGVAFCMEGEGTGALMDAVEVIDRIINKEATL